MRPLRSALGALRRALGHAEPARDERAQPQGAVRNELLARLALLPFAPSVVVDLGAGTGHVAAALRDRWRRARVLAIDRASEQLRVARGQQSWLRRFDLVCADAARLPFREQSVDLVCSNLMLQWVPDLTRLLAEVHRVLRPGGCFMFSTLGAATLEELRGAWAAVDGNPHLIVFPDLQDLGDALLAAGFADPVIDADRHTLTYADTQALLRDLRELGARAPAVARPAGLSGRGHFARLAAAYERHRRPDGRLPATFEVVYGRAWRPAQAPPARRETTIKPSAIGRRLR